MANSESISPISTIEIAWAAGFLEGEGSFINEGCPHVSAAQVQRQPVERLQRLFGGKITQRKTGGFSTKPIWVWKLSTHRSVEVMMTVFVLMSPKRQNEINQALERWKSARLMKKTGSKECARGHSLEGYNGLFFNGYVRCRECMNLGKRLRRSGRSSKHFVQL